ncbi:gluzincin family metallopeptidase [Niabella hibiscisoli]|uniref:hypothetical protein n=1 Tax=Niabella hibiscisoli TaxID=1825928 RepID=UPI001F0D54CC|nr:hypothetical protein [Niabella hibiscisoli]MCH5717266.1 hypothetical protein [Niabella hibiscisoli]
MKKIVGLLGLLAFSVSLVAQALYTPRNVRAAYDRGTRSVQGLPGSGYWQNKGVYDISVRVEPVSKTVTGTETILYSNNSPDTLQELVIRFVNNLHKPEAPRYDYFSKDFLTEGLKIKTLSIDRFVYKTDGTDWGTVNAIELAKPVVPGQQVEVKMEWSYPLSKESDREGQIDPQTFFVRMPIRESLYTMITTAGTDCRTQEGRSFIMILMTIT